MKEKVIRSLPGVPVLLALLALMLASGWIGYMGFSARSVLWVIAGVATLSIALVLMAGLYMVEPNQAAVLSFFGKYVGTAKENGLRWNNPFYAKRKVSMRVRIFESGQLKVN